MPDFDIPNDDDSYVEPDASTSHLNESSNKSTDMAPTQEPVRDEVKEIENLAKKDTNWIKGWRFLLIVCLAATATCVTVVTYPFLTQERHEAYKASVREHHFFVAKGRTVQRKKEDSPNCPFLPHSLQSFLKRSVLRLMTSNMT